MKFLQKVLNRFNGLHYKQEYLCLAKESVQEPLYMYLISGNKVIRNITNLHCFVGYKPLLFAIPSSDEISWQDMLEIELVLSGELLSPNDSIPAKRSLAFLHLKKISVLSASVHIYEATKGFHRFTSSFSRFMIRLNNRLFNKKEGNVYLEGNLYEQVQAAYSLSRTISLITVGNEGLYNLFPTDLHGPLNEQLYIISLRHEGKACQQVEKAGRICIAEVHTSYYKSVYALGKNHMQELKSKSSFPFGGAISKHFQLPLPEPVLRYRELELTDTQQQGIHKLLLFKVFYKEEIKAEPATLSHVHNVYATWRFNKGLGGNYLLR